MTDDLFEEYRRAWGVGWKKPPAQASLNAKNHPGGLPVSPVPNDSTVEHLRPGDIRSAAVGDAPAMLSCSFPGVDVTVLVTPPEGDGVWTIEGRAWRNPRGDAPIRVILALGENVADDVTVPPGGRFRFQDLLVRGWSLEFHLGDAIAVLQGPDSG